MRYGIYIYYTTDLPFEKGEIAEWDGIFVVFYRTDKLFGGCSTVDAEKGAYLGNSDHSLRCLTGSAPEGEA